jgi:hypothetical protein
MCFATHFKRIATYFHHMPIFTGKLWLRFWWGFIQVTASAQTTQVVSLCDLTDQDGCTHPLNPATSHWRGYNRSSGDIGYTSKSSKAPRVKQCWLAFNSSDLRISHRHRAANRASSNIGISNKKERKDQYTMDTRRGAKVTAHARRE